jgi:hypothetical protein
MVSLEVAPKISKSLSIHGDGPRMLNAPPINSIRFPKVKSVVTPAESMNVRSVMSHTTTRAPASAAPLSLRVPNRAQATQTSDSPAPKPRQVARTKDGGTQIPSDQFRCSEHHSELPLAPLPAWSEFILAVSDTDVVHRRRRDSNSVTSSSLH